MFEREVDADKAKQTFDGANAKGQPIKVTYEFKSVKPSSGSGNSLLSRIDAPAHARFGARAGVASRSASSRGSGGGKESTRGGRGGNVMRSARAAPKSTVDLDAELDEFMTTSGEAAVAMGNGDTEMV